MTDQEKLHQFLSNPDNLKPAIEASMAKRLAVIERARKRIAKAAKEKS